ncbi:hypothetical protein [Brachybacterium sp. GPGPB12]|uniref:hypothetical protein n=1 Tax=Brachybacterium sp. GPGPB12 TaxID=3023517 RepID=UPI0031343D1E
MDGIIAVTTWSPPEALEQAARSVPVVVIGRMQDPVPGTDAVITDDTAGAALAVRHLVTAGHRRLAHVTLSSRPGPAARRTGFLAETARLGLADAVAAIGPDSADDGIDLLAARAAARRRGRPDGGVRRERHRRGAGVAPRRRSRGGGAGAAERGGL